MRVKIFGAGSIGNHLSNASRAMGWSVDLCDVDPAALERTRTQIYPGRYGKWDDTIRLFANDEAPKGGYDLIFIGTPPDSHIPLALDAIKEQPRAILLEKPFCTPDLTGAQELFAAARNAGVAIFTGYDHVVGQADFRGDEAGRFALAPKALDGLDDLGMIWRVRCLDRPDIQALGPASSAGYLPDRLVVEANRLADHDGALLWIAPQCPDPVDDLGRMVATHAALATPGMRTSRRMVSMLP